MKIEKGTYLNTRNYGISWMRYLDGPVYILFEFGKTYYEIKLWQKLKKG